MHAVQRSTLVRFCARPLSISRLRPNVRARVNIATGAPCRVPIPEPIHPQLRRRRDAAGQNGVRRAEYTAALRAIASRVTVLGKVKRVAVRRLVSGRVRRGVRVVSSEWRRILGGTGAVSGRRRGRVGGSGGSGGSVAVRAGSSRSICVVGAIRIELAGVHLARVDRRRRSARVRSGGIRGRVGGRGRSVGISRRDVVRRASGRVRGGRVIRRRSGSGRVSGRSRSSVGGRRVTRRRA